MNWTRSWTKIAIPNLRGGPAFGEKQQVGLDPGPGGGEYPARQADDAPQIAIVQQLALGLDEGGFVGAEQHAFIKDDAAAPAVLERF